MLSLLSMIALRAVTNRALMVSSSRCGVSHLCSPLNLPLHCQITLRYFEVEFQTLESKYNVYQISGNQISVKTLDLNQDFSEIAAQLKAIVDTHFE